MLSWRSATEGRLARGIGEGKGVLVFGSMRQKREMALFQCYRRVIMSFRLEMRRKRCVPDGFRLAKLVLQIRTCGANLDGPRQGLGRSVSGHIDVESKPSRKTREETVVQFRTAYEEVIRYSGATEEHRSELTASTAAPILDDIQAYLAGSMTPVPRRPGRSQLWSSQKKSASESREKTSDGRLFMSISLYTSAKPQIKRGGSSRHNAIGRAT